jgi:hypothetical protein
MNRPISQPATARVAERSICADAKASEAPMEDRKKAGCF